MLVNHQHFIRERSNPILINNNLSTIMKVNSSKSEYSLNKNFFDPTKNSPPNEFMIKLYIRMDKYYMEIDRNVDDFDNK
jgi:hypothetical protein